MFGVGSHLELWQATPDLSACSLDVLRAVRVSPGGALVYSLHGCGAFNAGARVNWARFVP